MIFQETKIKGAFVIELEKHEDSRGFFARTFCREEFRKRGMNPDVAQCNISCNRRRGTLRGMHYQAPPHEEAKLVFCTRGAIHDVIIDLRPGSPTFKQHVAETLSADNRRMIFAPEGVAHGFLTLEDNTDVFYVMSESYHPECGRGVRWNDPAFGIRWPGPVAEINDRDRDFADFKG